MKVDELLNELKAIKMKHKGGLLSFLEEQEAERIDGNNCMRGEKPGTCRLSKFTVGIKLI